MTKHISTSVAETLRLAGEFARALKAGDAVLLRGELGAGKTEFARGLVRAIVGEAGAVPSPTFSLVQIYGGTPEVAHYDLYRVRGESELAELDLEESLVVRITIIEWPELALGLVRRRARRIFEVKIIIPAGGAADSRREIYISKAT